MPIVIGEASILVGADASDFEQDLDSQVSKSGKGIGSKITSVLGSTLKTGAKVVGGAAGGVLGTALFSGFKRLSSIDEAKNKLLGLGNTTAQVNKIMDNALTAVKGTSFGLDEAASAAGVMAASGIKAGKGVNQMTGVLSTIASTAAVAGVSFEDMSGIFSEAAASGKISGDTLYSLTSRGIPAAQMLAKQMGISVAEVQKRTREGSISFKQFNKAMNDSIGPAAKQMGKSFNAMLKNTYAALSRFGANLLAPVFAKLPSLLGKATDALDALGPVAEKIGTKVGNAFTKIGPALAKLAKSPAVKMLGKALADAFGHLMDAGKAAAPAIGKLVKTLAPIAKLAVGAAILAVVGALKVLGPVIEAVAKAFSVFVDIVTNPLVLTALASIGTGLLVAFAPTIASIVLFNAQMAIAIARMIAMQAAQKAAAAIRALGLAFQFAGGPITLIIAAIAAIVVAIVLLWKKNDAFRGAVIATWNAIKGAFSAVVNWITGTLVPMFSAGFKAIGKVVSTIVGFIKGHWKLLVAIFTGPIGIVVALIISNFDKIKSVITTVLSAVWNFIKKVWNGIKVAFTTVLKVISTVVRTYFEVYKKIIITVLNVVKAVVSKVWNAIKTVIGGVLDRIKSAISSGFNAAKNIVVNMVNSIKSHVVSGFNNMVSFIRGIPGKIRNLAGSFLNAGLSLGKKVISGIGKGLSAVGGFVSDIGSAVKRAINSALHLPFTIHGPGPLPDFTIPAFAKGTPFAPGGLALVGERGPEVVSIPRGARVYSAAQSRSMQGGTATISYGNIYVTVSVDDLAKMTKMSDFLKMLENARVLSRKAGKGAA